MAITPLQSGTIRSIRQHIPFGLHIPPHNGKARNDSSLKRDQCEWRKRNFSLHKLNFARASRGNLEVARVGCIVHHWDGTICGRLAKPIGRATNNEAKLEAQVEGLL